MADQTETALNALAQAVIENKGVFKVLQERHPELLYAKALAKILAAAEEVEGAWQGRIKAA